MSEFARVFLVELDSDLWIIALAIGGTALTYGLMALLTTIWRKP